MELRYKLKRVNFRENTLAFDRDKRICPLYTDVHLKRVSVEQGFTVVQCFTNITTPPEARGVGTYSDSRPGIVG